MADESNTLTPEQMAARIAELEGRLAKGNKISFKVSEKGAVSVYGLGRFPVTLYFEQWDILLSHADQPLSLGQAPGPTGDQCPTYGREAACYESTGRAGSQTQSVLRPL
jgi:hypothetical protein